MARLLAAAGAFVLAIGSQAVAAELGHARVVSAAGQPLKIDVPLVRLDAVEQSTLKVGLARSAAWAQAGLTPPVSLDSMHVRVTYAGRSDARMIEVSSDQAFDGTVADLLLSVGSAEGEQQYQISILTDTQGGRGPMLAPGGGVAAGARPAESAQPSSRIRVQRGDTMFAIAHRNAVPGVTIYQMMMALQRANPRAFIRNNVNLVRAGATLVVPGRAALTAISDREARRLFVQQAAEFEAYRQRLAGGAVPAVKGGSAASGRVSAATAVPAPAAGTPQDRVILSSGSSAADRAADQKVATSKAAADAKQRIAQLENNVHHLDQALHGGSQGSSGSAAAAGGPSGATAGAGGLAGAGSSAGGGSGSAGVLSSPLAQAAASGAVQAGGGGAHAPASSFGAVTPAGGAPNAAAGGGASTAGAAVPAGHAGSAGAAAPAGGSTAGSSIAAEPAGSSNPGAAAATASSAAASSSGTPPSARGESPPPEASNAPGGPAAAAAANSSNEMHDAMSWIQDHMLGAVTVVLALIVLIIAWVLRRINAVRDDGGSGSRVTEAMVREKLDQINLDLHQPPDDAPTVVKD